MDPRTVRIYSHSDTPRLRYIASLILGDILGLEWSITSDRRKLRNYHVINYSELDIPGAFRINPASLLFEEGVSEREMPVTRWDGFPVLFASEISQDFPFDIFAASFWLVTRYEEYLVRDRDEHGRFRADSSLAYRNGFLGVPVVDLWAKVFAVRLLKKFRTITFRRSEFSAIVTIDADEALANPGRSILRSIGDMLHEHKPGSAHQDDPYDVFGYMIESLKRAGADAKFFFPVGDQSRYDRNPSWKHPRYRELIASISGSYPSGLHPSYYSSDKRRKLDEELGRLSSITGSVVHCSRFHYLRLSLPDSYNEIIDAGITEDYSMGYSTEPGFRAGIARPFRFFDLNDNSEKNLKIYPFQLMDEALTRYARDREMQRKIITDLLGSVRSAGGTFISVWHNTSLLDDENCRGMREHFEFALNCQGNDNLS